MFRPTGKVYRPLPGTHEADDRARNVKSWWANVLNPGSSDKKDGSDTQPKGKPMNKDKLNDYRYQTCLAFIEAKNLASEPKYQNLIDSGTLRYLCQTTIELRQQANHHAHEIDINISDFREVLHTTKATRSDLCTASEFVSINGIVDFLIDVQAKN